MTNHTELVKALRCGLMDGDKCKSCKYLLKRDGRPVRCGFENLELDAADAIEKLVTLYEKAEMDATNLTGKLAQAEADIDRLNLEIDKRIATEIELSNQVDALQAEVKRLQDKLCDWCMVCPKERRKPEDCELLSETPVMYGPSEAKMEVQE